MLMVKTSSNNSVQPKKGIFAGSGGGKNRVKPVGKYEVDGDDGGGRNGDFDVTFKSTVGALDIVHPQE